MCASSDRASSICRRAAVQYYSRWTLALKSSVRECSVRCAYGVSGNQPHSTRQTRACAEQYAIKGVRQTKSTTMHTQCNNKRHIRPSACTGNVRLSNTPGSCCSSLRCALDVFQRVTDQPAGISGSLGLGRVTRHTPHAHTHARGLAVCMPSFFALVCRDFRLFSTRRTHAHALKATDHLSGLRFSSCRHAQTHTHTR
jgi:hypothetical protein